jgi:NADH-quinone oxidoreductase subunit B
VNGYVIGVSGSVLEQTSVPLPGGGHLRVIDAGLACCALEYSAATAVRQAWDALDASAVDSGPYEVLVVAGTVTRALLPVVIAAHDALAEGGVVVSFGACSTSGGPYWDSYAVVPGMESAGLAVDVHVPGCPPPPAALIVALRHARSIASERSPRRSGGA